MGEIVVEDPRTGIPRIFPIQGREPTAAEREAIEQYLRGRETLVTGSLGGRPSESGRSLFNPLPQNVGDLEPLTIGGAAMAGVRMGAPLGFKGMALGGMLGAGAGSLMQEGVADVGRETEGFGGLLGDDPRRGTGVGGPLGPASRATNEMLADLALPTGVSAVAGSAKRMAMRRIGKTIPDSGMRVMAYAQELNLVDGPVTRTEGPLRGQTGLGGVPLGVENVTESRTLRGVRNVLGRIPLINKEFRKLDAAQAEGLREAKGKILHEISPFITTAADVGVELSEKSFRRSRFASAALSGRYERWIERAAQEGVEIPAEPIRQVARDLLDSFRHDLPTRTARQASGLLGASGEALTSARQQPLDVSGVLDPSVLKFAEQLATLDNMTPRQYQTLQRTINQIIEQNLDNRSALRQASILKAGLETALDGAAGPQPVVQEIRDLNLAFSQHMRLLESPTGRRVGRTTGGLGRVFQDRTGDPDELYKQVFRSGSPKAMTDLFRLSGRRSFSKALRTHVEDAFEGSLQNIQSADDPSKHMVAEIRNLRRQLGLGRERSAQQQAMRRALDLADGPSFRQMERLFDVMEAVVSQKEIDVSQFMARRTVLGGVRSGFRAINPATIFAGAGGGAAGGAGFIAAGPLGSATALTLSVMGVVATRRATRLLTDPSVLKTATSLMNPNLPPSEARTLAMRLARLGGQDFIRDLEQGLSASIQALSGGADISQPQAEAIQRAPRRDIQIQEAP